MTVLTLFALTAAPALAQDLELPVLSPRAGVSQQVGTVMVSVDYSSPAQRDREIFGVLVPYGEVWRTGANNATTLTVDGEVTIGGVEVPEGAYTLMTIPGAESWTIILNSDPAARPWRHDESLDLPRFDVKPVEGPGRERLTFLFEDTTDRSTTLQLQWANVVVPLAIEVDTPARANRHIDNFVANAARRMSQAAMYQVDEGDLDTALQLADKAVSVGGGWYATFTLAKVQHARNEHKAAYKSAKLAQELGADDDNFFYKDQVEEALATWPKK